MQSFSPTGLVLGSHSVSSSEQRMSLVTTLRSPHLAVHCGEAGMRAGPRLPEPRRKGPAPGPQRPNPRHPPSAPPGTRPPPSLARLALRMRTSDHSDISHCGPQAGFRHVLRSSGRTASAASHRSLYTELSKPGESIFQQRTMRNW